MDTAGQKVVSQAGGLLLTETIRRGRAGSGVVGGAGAWRKPTAVHDPAKVILDLALTLAVGGDCLADVAVLRAEPGVYGRVASDPTVSRTIDGLAADADAALTAIDGPGRPAGRGRGSWPASTPRTTPSTPVRR